MHNPLLSKQANGWTIPIKEATRYDGFYPEAVGGGWNPSDGNDISSSLSKQMGGYMGGTRTSAPVQDYINNTYRGSQEIWDKDKDSEHAKSQTVPMVQDKKKPAKGKNALLQSPERRGTNPELRRRFDTIKFTISDMQRHLNNPSLLPEEKKEIEDTILHYQEMLDTLIAQARGNIVLPGCNDAAKKLAHLIARAAGRVVSSEEIPPFDEIHYIHYPDDNTFNVVLFENGKGVWSRVVEDAQLDSIVGAQAAHLRVGDGYEVHAPNTMEDPDAPGSYVPFKSVTVHSRGITKGDAKSLKDFRIKDSKLKVGQRRSSLNKPASAVPNAIKVHGLATKWMNENKAGRIAQVAGKYAVRSDADTITRRMAKLANRSIK